MKRKLLAGLAALAIALILPATLLAQSAISNYNALNYKISELLDKDKNPALQATLPKLNSAGRYPLSMDLLNTIHELNIEGNTDIALEVLTKIEVKQAPSPPPQTKSAGNSKELRDHLIDLLHHNTVPIDDAKTSDIAGMSKELNYYRYLKGESFFYAGDFKKAAEIFRDLLNQKTPIARWSGDMVYNYSEALASTKIMLDLPFETFYQHMWDLSDERSALAALNFASTLTPVEDLERVYLLLGIIGEKNSGIVLRRFRKILSGINGIDFLTQIRDALSDPAMLTLADLRRAELMAGKDQFDQATQLASQALQLSEDTYVQSEGDAVQEMIRVSRSFDRTKIGVLLPFSYEKFSRLVSEVMEGLLIAEQEAGGKFTLVFEDTALKPEVAEHKARKLILEDKVSAIIGPLAKNTTLSVGKVADQFGVPIFSLSRTEGIGKGFDSLFRIQSNFNNALDSIVTFSLDYLNSSSFIAIANPSDSNSEKISYINNRLGETGRSIAKVYNIKEDLTDFRDVFREISGKTYYLDTNDKNKNLSKDSGQENSGSFNIDSVFMFVKPRQLLSLENYFKTYKVGTVWLLMDQWHPEYRILKFMDDKVRFTGVYSVEEGGGAPTNYAEMHWAMLGHQENYTRPSYYSFFSYNALKLVKSLLSDNNIARGERVAKLKDPKFIAKAIPDFTYLGDGEITINETIFKLDEWKNVSPVF